MKTKINISGNAFSGRYVIVQMDNGEGVPLNLREVTAFGDKGETSRAEICCLDLIIGKVSTKKTFEEIYY